ncbi:hypothetical protein C7444_108104 [Sphaerotilus hippei]|uniref:DUF1365 family protein n=1 Tax=Sphaerotilus hippei TaxID=744406 RepID=A0A318GZS6_9BURK|nr:DUF1365 domain-containing protein [Sphaerotilus hippei]PXW95845.1 hypothetical protein C7444_108104 [Sphaerotilus hippei]
MKPPAPLLGRGVVRHTRLRPAHHAFHYPTWFLMLPMRTWRERPDTALPRNRRALVSFHDRDHGEGGDDALAWLESLLLQQGVHDGDGEVWLQTFPRVFGVVFKPVSFWFVHRRDDSLAAVVAEVNNTFGERHCYLLQGPQLGWGREQVAAKVFHVSPFCSVQGCYRFRFMRSPDRGAQPGRLVVRVDHDDAEGPLLQTSISGELQPLQAGSLVRLWASMPFLTAGVLVRIHLQAVRLWLKRVPFFRKPAPPVLPVTR